MTARLDFARASLMPSAAPMPDDDRPDMVAWYDPAQLFQTGVQTVLTEVFSTRADARLLMALGPEQPVYKPPREDEAWIDFIADTGDGWRPTTAVLRCLAAPTLDADGASLPRAELLVMGGDQVYPAGSVDAYEQRLLRPMREVSEEHPAAKPALLAIPGNHDWYDGLVGFVNTFAQGLSLGMWQTFQSRSYHCARLPHGHWLAAVDVQLQQDLDTPQRQWFERALEPMASGDRVILCIAEPIWVFRQQYGKAYKPQLQKLLAFIEKKGARVVLWIAGDLHHYRRMTGDSPGHEGVQYVTAGGGGAFLHPTHTPSQRRLVDNYGRAAVRFALGPEYPPRDVSRRLAAGNLFFPWHNPRFGFATAWIYTLLSWLLPAPNYTVWDQGVAATVREGLKQAATTPSSLVITGVVLAAVVAFTDSNKRYYRVGAGLLHGVAHLLAALLATGTSLWLARSLGIHDPILRRVFALGVTALHGYLFGGLIMGFYLWVSVVVFRRHANEAFSSLCIEGWKNFLRLKVDRDGVSVWAFGLDDVTTSPLRPKVIDRFTIPRV
jgi:hypothetical protein